MGFLGFGKKYTMDDLQREVTKLQNLYRQAIGSDPLTMSRTELKRALRFQLYNVIEVCKKGNFVGWELVEWCPTGPKHGFRTSLNGITPVVQTMIDLM